MAEEISISNNLPIHSKPILIFLNFFVFLYGSCPNPRHYYLIATKVHLQFSGGMSFRDPFFLYIGH